MEAEAVPVDLSVDLDSLNDTELKVRRRAFDRTELSSCCVCVCLRLPLSLSRAWGWRCGMLD